MSLLHDLLRLLDPKRVSEISSPPPLTRPKGPKPKAIDPAEEALDLINCLKRYALRKRWWTSPSSRCAIGGAGCRCDCTCARIKALLRCGSRMGPSDVRESTGPLCQATMASRLVMSRRMTPAPRPTAFLQLPAHK